MISSFLLEFVSVNLMLGLMQFCSNWELFFGLGGKLGEEGKLVSSLSR